MPESSQPDLYRDTPIRLLGYANELAEAFRPIIHKYTVYSGYILATGYMLADVADKSYKASKSTGDKGKWVMTAVDVMLWQGLASLVVPSLVINRFSAASRFAMIRTTKLGNKRINFISVVLSVGLIPFIVKPIDTSVDYFMDNYARQVLGTKKKND